jgi:hypothetical protein
MRFLTSFRLLALLPAFAFSVAAFGQNLINHKVITACGGRYEFTPPFTDFATLQITQPITGATTVLDSIAVESVQCLIKLNGYLYLAAGDSLLQYDLQLLTRVRQIYLPGINKIAAYGDILVISRQFPVTSGFVYVLDASTLDAVLEVTEVSGEAAQVLIDGNSAYVAVNGGWAGTTGKIALISLNPPAFMAEYDLGTEATGIFDLFALNGKILSVNKTPWGSTTGTVSLFNPSDQTATHHTLNHAVGNGYGIYQGKLYLNLDGNLGLMDLETFGVTNPVFIENPAAEVFGSIASASIDTLNGFVYLNTTDYFSFGQGYIYNAEGDSAGAYPAGISPDAMMIDYRDITSSPTIQTPSLTIRPNPVKESFTIQSTVAITKAEIYTAGGILVGSYRYNGLYEAVIQASDYKPGLYFLRVYSHETSLTKKIIKY